MSYRKGRSKEFYVLNQLKKVFESAYRVPLSGGWKGMDGDIRVEDLKIEVKGWRVYPKLKREILERFDLLIYKDRHRYMIVRKDGKEMKLKDFVRRFTGKPTKAMRWIRCED